jgi:hypothetical protein
MLEKTRCFQRDITVGPHLPKQFGLASFPALPASCEIRRDHSRRSRSSELDIGDDFAIRDFDRIAALRNTIKNLSFPAAKWSIVSRIVVILVICIAPVCTVLDQDSWWYSLKESPSFFDIISGANSKFELLLSGR